MLQTCYIYEITYNGDGRNYIGQRHCPLNKTPETDTSYMGKGKHILAAEKKYGIENFSKRILAICYTQEMLDIFERYFIKYYKSIGKAEFNIADGGEGGDLGIEVRRRISKSLREYYKINGSRKHTDEEKLKIKISVLTVYANKPEIKEKLRNVNHPPRTMEECKLISERLKGHFVSIETRRKIGEKSKNRKVVAGTHWYTNGIKNVRRKVCPEGYYLGMSGVKPMSDERKQHISESLKGKKIPKSVVNKRLNTVKNYRWFNNGIKETFAKDCPEGYSLGRIPLGTCWNKGKKNCFSEETIEKMRNSSSKGKHYYNNGIVELRAFDCPKGFVSGRLKRK